MEINMIRYKHYKFTYKDIANSTDALINSGKDYSVIRTWAYDDVKPDGEQGVDQYAKYWGMTFGAYQHQDVTEEHHEVFEQQLLTKIEEKNNETQSNN